MGPWPKPSGGSRESCYRQIVSNTLANQEPVEKYVVIYDEVAGDRFMFIHSTPWKGPEGEMTGVLIVLNDVTHLRRLENIRREFVSNASHEMKTPVTAIKASVETLTRGAITNQDDANRFVKIMEKHITRLEAIIEDLLNLSRIEQEAEKGEIKLSKQKLGDRPASSICLNQAPQYRET